MEDPEIVQCPDTAQVFETYRPFNITIPTFRDNTGIQSINSSHPLGAPVTLELTTVEFIATDFNNNKANCTVNIQVSSESLLYKKDIFSDVFYQNELLLTSLFFLRNRPESTGIS